MYDKSIDACVSHLYFADLLELFISSELFHYIFRICYIDDDVTSKQFVFCRIHIPLISFLCLVALAKTSSTTLKGSGESGHSGLLPVLSVKASSFTSVSMFVRCRFFADSLYQTE